MVSSNAERALAFIPISPHPDYSLVETQQAQILQPDFVSFENNNKNMNECPILKSMPHIVWGCVGFCGILVVSVLPSTSSVCCCTSTVWNSPVTEISKWFCAVTSEIKNLAGKKTRSHKSICLTYLPCVYLEQLVKLFGNLTYLAGRDQDSLWACQKQTLIHGFDIRGELYFKWSDARLFWHLYGEIQLSPIFKGKK